MNQATSGLDRVEKHDEGLQYTSAGHVLEFGLSQVVIGSRSHALTLKLAGARAIGPEAEPQAKFAALKREHSNRPRAEAFTTVKYTDPWPGVSVFYRAQPGAILESEYHLAPGFSEGTIRQIRVNYNRPVELTPAGELIIKYSDGSLQESAPLAWQEIEGKRIAVKVGFVQLGRQEIGYQAWGYDPRYSLTIDPSLTWNTFLGSMGTDNCRGLAIDGGGNVYVTGYSSAAWGAPIRAYTGLTDGFAAKLDNGGNVVWNTFIGGGGDDYCYSIAIDGSNNVYVAGISGATWGTPKRAYSGGLADGFVAQLNSSGNLVWNTFLGGGGHDQGSGIVIDGSNHVYVTGYSDNTWGAPIRAYSSGIDGFAAQLDSSGNLVWNTFLGGAGDDYCTGIAIDGSNQVYVAGYSSSTWGTPIRAYSAGEDGFAAKLDNSGDLVWSAFVGGAGVDNCFGIRVDGSNLVYVTGYSSSTWGTPVRAYSALNDGFAAQMDNGGNLVWSAFVGGAGSDFGLGIAIDGSGNVCVAGYSAAIWGAPIRAYSAGSDGFVAKLDNPSPTPTMTPTFAAIPTHTETPTAIVTPSASVTLTRTATPWTSTTATITRTVSATRTPSPIPALPAATPTLALVPGQILTVRPSVVRVSRGERAQIYLQLQASGRVKLRVFDLQGKQVATLLDEDRSAGTYQLTWDAAGQGSGLYYLYLDAAGQRLRQKLVLVR